MKVNIISESEFFPGKDQGVHTAYRNQVQMLRSKGIDVSVNFSRKADITHIHTVGAFSLYKLRTNHPTVVTAHIIPSSFVGSLIGTTYWLPTFSSYIRYFYNHASLVLAVAPQVKKELENLGVKTRIEIFPNVIDTNHFKKDARLRLAGRKELKIDEKRFVLIGVGQVQQRKGIGDFITMAEKYSDYFFLWIGGTPFKGITAQDAEMKRLLHHPPKNFLLMSAIPYDKMPIYYNVADAFYFPSYQENASMAIIEAAACGLPLVMRDIQEYRKLYTTGYIAAKTYEEFAASIKKLASDAVFYRKEAEESRRLSGKYSYDALGDLLISYYKSLLNC